MIKLAEYIWMDGASPTQKLRSKSRVVELSNDGDLSLKDFPEWTFDGSSTYQSPGHNSDLVLKPCTFVKDPIRGEGNYLLMCEVWGADGKPHVSNTRAILRRVLEAGGAAHEPMVGFEQEYTLFEGRGPLGWPENGYPAPQGPFYCGVGSDEVFGRHIIEDHTQCCIDAGINIYGINAEVMPGQWEFQIGYRGFEGDNNDVLSNCDQLWLARWLLYRVGEDYNVSATLHNKPVQGDWNGSGQHTNFSTKEMRQPGTGMKAIEEAIGLLKKKHSEHIAVYGHGLEERLTGAHETCRIDEFRSGVSDRGAAVRIPLHVAQRGHGYLEDRRPGANADPYKVCARLIQTICKID